MNLRDLLDSEMDLASLAALVRQGLGWWLGELGQFLPEPLRGRLSTRPRLWIEPRPEGGWRVWRDGRLMGTALAPPAGRARVGLVAPPDAVLIRDVVVPRLPAADIRRLVSLDIGRLSPLAPELIVFDVDVRAHERDDGQQTVRLAIVPRDEAARLLALSRAAGTEPVALAARTLNEAPPFRFDVLAQAKAAGDEPPTSRARAYGWAAVAGLILINLALLIGRDIVDVERLTTAVESQRPAVETALRLRRRVEGEDARRRALLASGRKADPLSMLNVVTQALPRSAWTQHLEWNGQTLHLSGFKEPAIDIAAAIRGSGAFTNPRVLGADAARSPADAHAFDITADARPEPRP